MKRFTMIVMASMVSILFITTGCMSTNAQKGAGLGALTGMAGSALMKGDREDTAIAGAVGAGVGYMMGNEIDKSNTKEMVNRNKKANNNSSSAEKNCRKVVTKKLVDGKWIKTVKEVCESTKTEQGVY